jgi:hypothetical protein
MPRYKYVANRFLTAFENLVVRQKLSEYHTGLRAYSRDLLQALPFELNSDDFVFDNEVILQVIAAGARVGELSCPTRYAGDSSSINFQRSVRYGFGVMRAAIEYRLHKSGLMRAPFLDFDTQAFAVPRQPVAIVGKRSPLPAEAKEPALARTQRDR